MSQRLSTSLPYAGKQSLYRRAFQNNLSSILHYLLHTLTLLSSISRATGKIFAMRCRHCKLVSKIPILPCSLGLWTFCFSFDNVFWNSSIAKQNKSKIWKPRWDSSHYAQQPSTVNCWPGNSELFPVWRHSFRNVARSWMAFGRKQFHCLMSCDHELANEKTHCSRKNASYITIFYFIIWLCLTRTGNYQNPLMG